MKILPAIFILSLLIMVFAFFSGCTDVGETPSENLQENITQTTEPPVSSGIWRVDHAVIVVSNLSGAKEKFRLAGFNVSDGGNHSGNMTQNALISFSDKSYIELFSAINPSFAEEMKELYDSGNFESVMNDSDAMDKRFMLHLAKGEGICDFAISYDSLVLDDEKSLLEKEGFLSNGPIAMSRTTKNGQTALWHVLVPEITPAEYAGCFPFFITDDTEREIRVPGQDAASHSNGALGIKRIDITTNNKGLAAEWYNTVFSEKDCGCTNPVVYSLNDSGTDQEIRIYGNFSEGAENKITDIVLGTTIGDEISISQILQES